MASMQVLPALLPTSSRATQRARHARVAHIGLKPQDGEQSVHETHFIVSASTLVTGTPARSPPCSSSSSTRARPSAYRPRCRRKDEALVWRPTQATLPSNFQIPLPWARATAAR